MPSRPLNELPPSSWPLNPDYVMDLDPLPFRLRAEVAGETIVDSTDGRVMFELGHAPVYYVPKGDVRMDLMTPTDLATHCPYKGDASYWSLAVGDTTVENIIWGYEDPYAEMAHLKGYVGVYWDRIDAWYHGDQQVDSPVEIAGRVNETNHFKACYPHLMAEWNSERNQRIGAYEFSAESNTEVWWKDAAGHEWRERIKDRVLRNIGGVEQPPLAAE
jgi:uncharacterized protein (DUF427 family)